MTSTDLRPHTPGGLHLVRVTRNVRRAGYAIAAPDDQQAPAQREIWAVPGGGLRLPVAGADR
jgi:hypothetical protein